MQQFHDEHGERHGGSRPDTVADALLLLAMVRTVWHVVGVLGCLVALVMHVPYARLCCVLRGRHPGPGTPGVVEAGSGAVPRRTHQLSVQSGPGAMCRAKDVAADVGNDANHDHVHVHVAHYPGRTRKEAG
jgi:hypothetical protein